MNGVVGLVCDGNQKLWIKNAWISRRNVVRRHWVHVMDDDPIMNFIAFYSEIATVISDDDSVAKLTPLSRGVELLIHVSIESERRLTDVAMKSQVLEPFLDGVESSQFRVSSNHHPSPTALALSTGAWRPEPFDTTLHSY